MPDLPDNFTIPPAFIYSHPGPAAVYIIIDLASLLLGVFGNLLLLITLLRNPKLQKIGREFIINLAVADLCVAAIAEPLCLIAIFKTDYIYYKQPVLCEVFAALCLSSCYCAFLSLGLLTLSRMFYICHNSVYHRVFGGPRRRWAFCLACWLIAGAFEVGNLSGWGNLHYVAESGLCIWHQTKKAKAYTYFVTVGLICTPLVGILAANLRIFFTVSSTKRLLVRATSQDTSKGSVWSETIRACRTLFVICGAFTVCWVPYAVVNLVDVASAKPINGLIHLYATLLAHTHSAINFSLYLSTNKPFREAFISSISTTLFSTTSTNGAVGQSGSSQVQKVTFTSSGGTRKASCATIDNSGTNTPTMSQRP